MYFALFAISWLFTLPTSVVLLFMCHCQVIFVCFCAVCHFLDTYSLVVFFVIPYQYSLVTCVHCNVLVISTRFGALCHFLVISAWFGDGHIHLVGCSLSFPGHIHLVWFCLQVSGQIHLFGAFWTFPRHINLFCVLFYN